MDGFTNHPQCTVQENVFGSPHPPPQPPSPTPEIILWVKEEPFLFGILSPNPCSKLAVTILRKVALYCSERKGYFPHIRFNQWNHISKYKLQISHEFSWTLIRGYHILRRTLPMEPRSKWDSKVEDIRRTNTDATDELRVDTLSFLLYLYIQNFHTLLNKHLNKDKRSPSFNEVWPCTRPFSAGDGEDNSNSNSISNTESQQIQVNSARSYRSSSSSNNSKGKRNPEDDQLIFVRTNLQDILELVELAGKGKQERISEDKDGRISLQVVSCLSFIIGATSINNPNSDEEFPTLDACITAVPEVAWSVGFDRESLTVSRDKFLKWVRDHLKLNPWGPSSTPITQVPVNAVIGSWMKGKHGHHHHHRHNSHTSITAVQQQGTNKIYWNTRDYPKGWYLISSINYQILYLDSLRKLSSIKIHRCYNSYLYIPGAFNSIIIEKCHNCLIFLGPSAKCVKFIECSTLRISAVGRLFIIQDTIKSVFHLLTPCHPVICGNKGRKVVFGPYNTYYPKLEEDMELVGIDTQVEKWNHPLELDWQGCPVQNQSCTGVEQISSNNSSTTTHSLLQPEKFFNLTFPFGGMEGGTKRNPSNLPKNYEGKLAAMEQAGVNFKMEVNKMNLTHEKRKQLNGIVQTRFLNWLKKEGHLDHLHGLKSIQKSIRMEEVIPVVVHQKGRKPLLRESASSRSTLKEKPEPNGGMEGGRSRSSGKSESIISSSPKVSPAPPNFSGSTGVGRVSKSEEERISLEGSRSPSPSSGGFNKFNVSDRGDEEDCEIVNSVLILAFQSDEEGKS